MTFPMSFPEKAAKLEAKTDQKVYIPFASKEE